MKEKDSIFHWFKTREFFKVVILILSAIIAFGAIIYPISFMKPWPYQLNIGDVAPQDIQATESLNYDSEILTENAKQLAMDSVSPIYLPTDTNIARKQIELLRTDLAYVSSVRQDNYATTDQKLSDIAALADIRISQEIAQTILALEDNQWQSVQQETLRVLEQVMRNAIREDRVSEAKRNVASLISFSLPDDQSKVVNELVQAFVVPNNLYSEELTTAAKIEAAEKVIPVKVVYVEGETIVNKGQIINPTIREALQEFELIRPQNEPQTFFAAFLLVLVSIILIYAVYNKFNFGTSLELADLIVIAITFSIFLFAARIVISENEILAYLFPIPAFGLIIAFLFNRELALLLVPILGIMSAYGLNNYSTELGFYYFATSIFGILFLGRGRRISSFFRSGLATGFSGIAIIMIFEFPNGNGDWFKILSLSVASLGNGIFSASLTLLIQSILAQILGLTTPLRLLDISRPDHPLLQYMLQQTPGTYQHSLQVANLAVQAAEAIGANALLVRVGALYHDAGKAQNPSYFIENQVSGQVNPHDMLDPQTSSKLIVQHVLDGVKLAKKYRLPPRINDFIREHHGTMLTNYQYTKAVQAVNNDKSKVDLEKFRYPGPSPRSKETALLMIADGVEARARAILPQSEKDLRDLVRQAVNYLQKEGQLDQTALTLKDLALITESFVTTLKNTHHLRIQYPKLSDEDEKEDDAPQLTAPQAEIKENIPEKPQEQFEQIESLNNSNKDQEKE